MFKTAARLTALGCFALLACNETDVVAHGVVAPANREDASTPSCDIAAQLARAKLPTGLANVFVDCEWPLRRSDNPDQLGELLPTRDEEEAQRTDMACAANPYRWWQEPPLPAQAQRLLYCPKACDVVKSWIRCKLREDVCNREDAASALDADGGEPPARHADGGAVRCGP
jgi:hypothetical protein